MLRSRVHAALVATALLGATPAVSFAQACLGNASFATGHLQLSADAATANNSTSFVAGLGGGSESVFGTLAIGGVQTEGIGGTQLLAGGSVGYQVPVTSGSLQMCPVLRAQFGFGPRDVDGLGTDLSSRAVGFGLSLGGEMLRAERLVLIPAVSLGFAYASSTADGVGGSVTDSDTYGLAGLTLGLVLNNQLSIRPGITVPFGLEDADPILGIGFTLNYGGRR